MKKQKTNSLYIFENNEEIKQKWQKRLEYIMIDQLILQKNIGKCSKNEEYAIRSVQHTPKNL